MREVSVVGFIPSRSAAPFGPKTLPSACLSAWIMLSRSSRFSSSRVSKGGGDGALEAGDRVSLRAEAEGSR